MGRFSGVPAGVTSLGSLLWGHSSGAASAAVGVPLGPLLRAGFAFGFASADGRFRRSLRPAPSLPLAAWVGSAFPRGSGEIDMVKGEVKGKGGMIAI